MKPRWLDRTLVKTSVFYTLVTNEAMYFAECKRCGVPRDEWGVWILAGCDGTVSNFTVDGLRICIVSVDVESGRDPIDVAGTIVHEAVHVWQTMRRKIGEENPSIEFEAYSIQRISQELMREYVRQTQSA